MNASPDQTALAAPDLPVGLLDRVVEIARAAGDRILDFYRSDLEVERKADKSPVTEADHAADAIIVPALEGLTPDIPVISEERANRTHGGGWFWLVDPLDGTKEFLKHRDEFTVNIALVDGDRRPTLGVVGVPARDRLYAAFGPGTAVSIDPDGKLTPIRARPAPPDGVVVAASRSHANKPELEDFLAEFTVDRYISAGSSLKFCLVAEGQADLYPRLAPTMEWDTAAGQAIVEAAGGSVRTTDGAPLRYAKPGFRNPHFVVRGLGG